MKYKILSLFSIFMLVSSELEARAFLVHGIENKMDFLLLLIPAIVMLALSSLKYENMAKKYEIIFYMVGIALGILFLWYSLTQIEDSIQYILIGISPPVIFLIWINYPRKPITKEMKEEARRNKIAAIKKQKKLKERE